MNTIGDDEELARRGTAAIGSTHPCQVACRRLHHLATGRRAAPGGKRRTATNYFIQGTEIFINMALPDGSAALHWNLGCSWCMMPAQQVG